jgi:tetratricopeptide (TPR) repeat protein
MANNILDGILANEKFVDDYSIMAKYWSVGDSLKGKLNLKEVIELFNSDVPMYLATDGENPRILAEGEALPEGYSWIGKLSPKIDSHIDGKTSDYILAADGYYIPVDVDAAVDADIISEDEREIAVSQVDIALDKSVITRDHLMMLDLFANFDWKRPLAFTQASLLSDYGIVNYARFNGYAYLFVPIRTPYYKGSEVGSLNVDSVVDQYMGSSKDELRKDLRYGNLAQEGVYVDYFVRYNLSASRLRENFARIASALLRRGDDADVTLAEKLLDRGLEVMPPSRIGYTHSAVLPYIRGYYYAGLHYLEKSIKELEQAISIMAEQAGMNVNVERGDDEFTYFYELSDRAAALHSTVRKQGADTAVADGCLKRSDEAFDYAEALLFKGDRLAAEYIAERGEWVRYYMQFDTQRSFSPTISSELYNAMLDIVEVVSTSHLYSGSFDWVANPDANHRLVDNALSFDALTKEYVEFVNRLTPGSDKDAYMAVMAPHIGNIVEIYEGVPVGRVADGGYVDAEYVEPMDKFLSRKELREVISQWAE